MANRTPDSASSQARPNLATKILSQAYVIMMALLAIAVIGLIAAPETESWVYDANLSIWAIFVIDYAVRLVVARDKRKFVREHIIDLVAIIPFEAFLANEEFAAFRLLRVARIARLIWLIRAGAVLWRMSRHTRGVLNTNGVGYVLLVALFLVVMGGIGMWAIEPDIGTPLDGVWWGFVTATTVGYGDIAPKTLGGRVVGVGLMLVGIGCISTLSASIATYFLGHRSTGITNPHVAYVSQCLGRWDELSSDERRQTALVLTALASDASDLQASSEVLIAG